MLKRLFTLLVMSALTLPILAQDTAESATLDDAFINRMETIIESAQEAYNVPGAAVAFVQGGEIVYSAGFGVRNLETGAPVTPETLFRAGSTLKSATAMLIATLVDEGLVTWDTPISELVPGLRFPTDELTQTLTIGEIMGHGTGLGTAIVPFYWNQTDAQAIIAAQANAPIVGERGESYFYNNEMFVMAGYAAAHLAGNEGDYLSDYAALMQARLFDPIGMTSFRIADDPTLFSENAAVSYSINLMEGMDTPAPTGGYMPISAMAPAGGAVGDVEDMARYLITQLNNGVTPDGTRIVSEANLLRTREVQNPTITEDFVYPEFVEYVGYGMGWVTLEVGGVEVLWHNGGIDGFLTDMLIIPEADAGMVIMSNSFLGFVSNMWVMFEFVNQLYELGIEDIEAGVEVQLNAQMAGLELLGPLLTAPTVNPAAMAPFLGDYEDGWTLALDETDAGALLRLDREGMLLYLLPFPFSDNYIMVSGSAIGLTVTITTDEDGNPVMSVQTPTGESLRLERLD